MANICTNMFFCSSENQDSLEQVENYLKNTFDVWNTEKDEDFIEVEFGSRWSFPTEEMEQLTGKLKADNSLYMRCLSHEFGNEYVSCQTYQDNEWDIKI